MFQTGHWALIPTLPLANPVILIGSFLPSPVQPCFPQLQILRILLLIMRIDLRTSFVLSIFHAIKQIRLWSLCLYNSISKSPERELLFSNPELQKSTEWARLLSPRSFLVVNMFTLNFCSEGSSSQQDVPRERALALQCHQNSLSSRVCSGYCSESGWCDSTRSFDCASSESVCKVYVYSECSSRYTVRSRSVSRLPLLCFFIILFSLQRI